MRKPENRLGELNTDLRSFPPSPAATADGIDGRLLRTGAANFSASGLKRQDNDLIVIESVDAAAAFKRNFDAQFAEGDPLARGAQ
jgi:hypothetical protein